MTEAELAALARRIEMIESRQQITDLVYRYTEFVRDRAEKECVSLMAEDVWIELHYGYPLEPGRTEMHQRFEGKDAILGSFVAVAGHDTVVWPMIHNLRIEIDGDTARSRCVMASTIRPYAMQNFGEYRDTFRREDGKWLFTSRTFIGMGDMDGRSAAEANDAFEKVKS